jgi:hypothetical protein
MMRTLMVAAVVAGCAGGVALAVTPDIAQARDPVRVEAALDASLSVTFSDELQERFEATYGVREKATLEAEINRRLGPMLQRGYHVTVEVLDARPNRPTFKQMGDRPGLSFQSFGIGGASLRAVVRAPDGRVAEPLSYSWYETDITQSFYQSTWGDASTAIDGFARRLNASVAAD